MKYNYGVSDKIIATMNKMIKAIKYNVNIAIVDKLFQYVDNLFYWIDMYIVNNTIFCRVARALLYRFQNSLVVIQRVQNL